MSIPPSLLHACACLACLAAPAATTLTVHNHTGRTLAVTRLWSPWRPEPDDGPMTIPFFQRWIKPGARHRQQALSFAKGAPGARRSWQR